MSDRFYFIDGDSNEHDLSEVCIVTMEEGFGIPEGKMYGQRMPFEDGEIYDDFDIPARELAIGIVIPAHLGIMRCRRLLQTWLNPKLGLGTLKRIKDGWTRQIDCSLVGGLSFPVSAEDGVSEVRDVLRFRAPWPYFYHPTQKSVTVAFNGATPVTLSFDNEGDVDAYPVIEVAATVNHPVMARTDDTDIKLDLDYNITAGTVEFDCRRGKKSVMLGATDLYEDLSTASRFYVLPRGAGSLTLTATSGTGNCTGTWTEWFLGF